MPTYILMLGLVIDCSAIPPEIGRKSLFRGYFFAVFGGSTAWFYIVVGQNVCQSVCQFTTAVRCLKVCQILFIEFIYIRVDFFNVHLLKFVIYISIVFQCYVNRAMSHPELRLLCRYSLLGAACPESMPERIRYNVVYSKVFDNLSEVKSSKPLFAVKDILARLSLSELVRYRLEALKDCYLARLSCLRSFNIIKFVFSSWYNYACIFYISVL